MFNTAILYDIENLIGGYGNTDMISVLSLKDIHNEILKKEIGKIAIQRAYANWSDSRLSILRGDIVELGIEPIQMFGFGRGPQKNASDIQLAIDAIDIAFTKQAVDIFVIVSGDGGFSALAKKLHEYGKMVIGCAFKRTTNRVFKAVCDDFIWIEEPKEGEGNLAKVAGEFTDPIIIDYAKRFKPLETKAEEVFKQTSQILNFLIANKNASYSLTNSGLNISVFSQILSYRIKDFNYIALGFTKFVDFIRYVLRGSQIKLIHNPPSEYRLLFHDSTVVGFEDVEPLTDLIEIHSPENYQFLLSRGFPMFRLPSSEIVFNLAHHLSENKAQYQNLPLGDIIDDLGAEYDYAQSDIKGCVLSLVSAGCFIREPAEAKLSEQKLSFIHQSSRQTINMLQEAMYRKLNELLGNVNDEVFDQILNL